MFPEPGYESITVSTINSNGKDVKAMSEKLANERGYLISAGYGKLKDSTFRIGHMGEWTLAGIKDVLANIDDIWGLK
jgi:aspartate aminotransferase-like enzyme